MSDTDTRTTAEWIADALDYAASQSIRPEFASRCTLEAKLLREASRRPEYDEDVAVGWAQLLIEVAQAQGAPNFAWHLAERGLVPEDIRVMAERWRTEHFEPEDFAGELDLFADAVEALSGSRHGVFR